MGTISSVPVELKPLEVEILHLLAKGLRSREIARKLGYTASWIRTTVLGLKRLALYSSDPLLLSCLRQRDYQKAQKFTPSQIALLEELIQGQHAKEIAAKLGRPEGSIKVILARARRRSQSRTTPQMIATYVEWKHEQARKLAEDHAVAPREQLGIELPRAEQF